MPTKPNPSGITWDDAPSGIVWDDEPRAADRPYAFGGLGFTPEFRQASGLGNLDAFKPALSDVFGADDDVANAIARKVPGAKLVRDADGFAMVELPNGERFALDKPGIQGNEVAAGVGQFAAYLPAGRIASGLGSLGARVLGGGVLSGATNAGLQTVAGRDEIDTGEVAAAGVGGSAGELAVPILGKAGQAVGRFLRSTFGDPLDAGRKIAASAGLSGLSDDALRYLGEHSDEVAAGAKPETLLAQQEFGLRFTRGQKTGDPEQLALEARLRTGQAGEPLRTAQEANRDRIGDALRDTQGRIAGDAPIARDAQEAASRIGAAFRTAEQGAARDVDEAYGRLGQYRANVEKGALADLPRRLTKAVSDFSPVLATDKTMAASRALQTIRETVANMPEEVSGVTLKAIEAQRRRLNAFYGAAKSDTDRAAMMAIKREFDTWRDEAVTKALMPGSDPKALNALKEATETAASYFSRFDSRMAKQLLTDATPEQVAGVFVNASGINKAAGAKLVREYAKAVGKDSDGWNALRQLTFLRIMRPRGAEASDRELTSALREAMEGRGKTMMQELFTPQELGRISRLKAALESATAQGTQGQQGERFWRFAQDTLSRTPLAGWLPDVRAAWQARSAMAPMAPRVRIPGLPAGGASVSADATRGR